MRTTRWPSRSILATCLLFPSVIGCGDLGQSEGESKGELTAPARSEAETVRIALFNIRELRQEKIDEVNAAGRGFNPQLLAAAEIIRRTLPDVLVLQEIDHGYASSGATDLATLALPARRFADLYLAPTLEYEHLFVAPNNTGILSGIDLDGDGHVATDADRGTREHGNDSYGYGTYPGEYSMAILSNLPLEAGAARSFQRFLWRDLPGHHIPADHFTDEALAELRLSSKSHWDVPMLIGNQRVHLLVSHPTPPGFDGDEDKNGRRNFDEIKLWQEYIDGSDALADDAGLAGGLGASAAFVVLGDLNAKPGGTDSIYDGVSAIDQLLSHPRVRDTGDLLVSDGPDAGPTDSTAPFGGGVRIDYILPSLDLTVIDGGVFWPSATTDPEGAELAETASDHRLLWVDLGTPD